MNITYYKDIYSNHHFRMRDLNPLIRRAVETNQPCYYQHPLIIADTTYFVSCNPKEMTITFRWEEEGKQYEREVMLWAENSNLPNCHSKVYYFICPRMGSKCRMLFRIGSFLWGRRGFKAVYPGQNSGKRKRILRYMEEPYKSYGKRQYKGKETPYGKRCQRYEMHEEQLYKYLDATSERIRRRKSTHQYDGEA